MKNLITLDVERVWATEYLFFTFIVDYFSVKTTVITLFPSRHAIIYFNNVMVATLT